MHLIVRNSKQLSSLKLHPVFFTNEGEEDSLLNARDKWLRYQKLKKRHKHRMFIQQLRNHSTK